MIGDMATHRSSRTIFDATTGLAGMCDRHHTDSHYRCEGKREKFFHYSAISEDRSCTAEPTY